MLAWYTELSPGKRKAFWGAYAGWGLDAMDVQVFSFLVPSLIAAWGMTRTDAGLLGTSALIFSALGGWLGGILSDRVGRVRTMQITILWYSLFTLLSGFTRDFDQLLVARSLQGIGFGGEWAAGAVLVGEIVRPANRGKTVGCLGSSYALGWGVAAIMASLVLAFAPAAFAWRIVFWIGVTPALLVLFIRRFVEEPQVFQRAKSAEMIGRPRVSTLAIFQPPFFRRTALACVLSIGLQGAVVTLLTWLPTYLKMGRGLSVSAGGAYVAVVTAGAFFGYIINGYLSDNWGRRRCLIAFCAACYVVILAYTYIPLGNTAMLLLGFPLGFFALGNFGSLAPYLTELFPTEIRATGQGFSNSVGRCIGGGFVAAAGILSEHIPLGEAVGLLALGGYAIAAVAVILLPETNGSVLTSLTAGETPELAPVKTPELAPVR